MFVPLFLLLFVCSFVLFAKDEPFVDKLMVSITSFLVLVATKFALNQDLPHVGYMTTIDKVFLVAYSCIVMTALVNTLHKISGHVKIEFHARWIIPLVFILGTLSIFVF